MPRFLQKTLTTVLAAALAVAPLAPASAGSVTPADYETCKAADDTAFRQAIEAVTVKALSDGVSGIDYDSAVAIEWRRQDLDAVIDKRVDAAVDEVRQESSWSEIIQSLGSQDKAQELATAVAGKVYSSDAMRIAIENLAGAVGSEAGKRIEMAGQDAAGPALRCLETFLGPRYGSTVAAAVTTNAGSEFGLDASKGSASLSKGAALSQSKDGLTGAALILMRRQIGNLAQRIGSRIAGSVLSRLVTVAAGGVGLVLLAKDIWQLRHGVLPIIAEEMKSKDTKDKVRQELATRLRHEIGLNVKDIAERSAGRVVEVWQEFRRAHAKAIELAGRDASFKSFLETVAPTSFARLDEVVSLVLSKEGEGGVLARAGDGTLAKAVKDLPEAGMTIARETGSVAAALAWSATAGSDLGKIVEYEIHKRANPEDVSQATLDLLFGLGDRIAIKRVAALGRGARDVLLDLDSSRLAALARALDERELDSLAGYLKGLGKGPRERVLEAVAATPSRMQDLAAAHVRSAIVASRDQAAAVEMMLRPEGNAAAHIADDFTAVFEGRVKPVLFWEQHSLAVGLAGLAAVLVLVWLKRLVMPARRPPPTPPGPADTAAPA